MWSNTGGVDISLDSLSPGASKGKAPLPSMNQLSGQPIMMQQPAGMVGQQQFYNNQQTMMMNNRMANMNLGMPSPVRMQSSAGMMQPNMGRQMGMGHPQMNIGMNMNMQAQQPQMQQNFTQFKAS